MTALLLAASSDDSWPGAVTAIAGLALLGFVMWLMLR